PGLMLRISLQRFAQHDNSQIASRSLFALDGLEQRLEIAFAEALRPFALNDFEKERRTIFHRLGENLEQITFVIAINKNPESLQRVQFFVDVSHAIEQSVIVSRWHS